MYFFYLLANSERQLLTASCWARFAAASGLSSRLRSSIMTRTSTCFALRRCSFAECGSFSSLAVPSRKFAREKSRSYEMTRRLTIREGFSDTWPPKKNFSFANRLLP